MVVEDRKGRGARDVRETCCGIVCVCFRCVIVVTMVLESQRSTCISRKDCRWASILQIVLGPLILPVGGETRGVVGVVVVETRHWGGSMSKKGRMLRDNGC